MRRIMSANPGFALVDNYRLDGLDFQSTHPKIYNYIRENYTLIHSPSRSLQIYVSRRNS